MTWLTARVWPYLAAVGAILAAAWGLVAYGSKSASDGLKIDALQKNQKSQEAGRNAVAKENRDTAGASKRDLVDRLRDRDGDWRM